MTRDTTSHHLTDRRTADNSTYPKGGVSCSKDSFVVNGSLVLRMIHCAEKPANCKFANPCAILYRTDRK